MSSLAQRRVPTLVLILVALAAIVVSVAIGRVIAADAPSPPSLGSFTIMMAARGSRPISIAQIPNPIVIRDDRLVLSFDDRA